MSVSAAPDNKYTRWAFTAYEDDYPLLEDLLEQKVFKEMGWQDEICPTSSRKHRQGWLVTQTPTRFSALKKITRGIHVEPCKNIAALKAYCSKEETRDPSGSQVHVTHPSTHVTVDKYMDLLADLVDQSESQPVDADRQYWQLVNLLLPVRPELAHLAMAPGPKTLWVKTRFVWLNRARERSERVAESISITDEAPELEFISLSPL